ncbi:MAG TPA: oxygenase MpaB family protein, partial [Terriglobales bacterium]|nr:oxygenase MpaB family protein [Terriglobales bacterium]
AHGDSYTANDPKLLLWVYATLIDSMRYAYRTFLPQISAHDWAQFYEEGKLFGKLIGIPIEFIPRSWAEFDHWMEGMLRDEIRVSDIGIEVADSLLSTPFRLAKPLTSFLAAGTLPASLRAGFHLTWTPTRQRLFDFLAGLIRFFSGHLPQFLHTAPTYWIALRRAQSNSG